MSCEFCQIGEHHVEDCQLLKHMTGVYFDKLTRQVLWNICTKHKYYSSNRHATCELCHEDDLTIDLRLVRDAEAWRAYIRTLEPVLRRMCVNEQAADVFMRRLLGRLPGERS